MLKHPNAVKLIFCKCGFINKILFGFQYKVINSQKKIQQFLNNRQQIQQKIQYKWRKIIQLQLKSKLMKVILACIAAVAVAYPSYQPTHYEEDSYEAPKPVCTVGSNNVLAHDTQTKEGCRCPAEFEYDEKKGCVRSCTVGHNGVQAHDTLTKEGCRCPAEFWYDAKLGCVEEPKRVHPHKPHIRSYGYHGYKPWEPVWYPKW